MRFGLSPEQVQLQASIDRLLTAQGGLDVIRRHASGDAAAASSMYSGLADLGACGVRIEDRWGGSGLSLLDAMLVSEVLGRHVSPVPFIASCVAAPEALQRFGSEAQQARWLPRLATGEATAGLALSEIPGQRDGAGVVSSAGRISGRVSFVLNPGAPVLLAADRSGGLHLVEGEAPGLTRVRLETIDATRDVAEVVFDQTPAEPLPRNRPGQALRILDVCRVMFAADTLGAAQRMLDLAVAYAGQREQFGRPIATFQAVKHMCAEMAAALEPCRALVWYAAHALDALPEEASLMACHAKAHLSEVGTEVARTATEVHGGMGFTDLLGLHYWFKRIGFNRQILGGPQTVRSEGASLRGLVA